MPERNVPIDGGLAFPFVSHGAAADHQYMDCGMTLRDWFAAAALSGFLRDWENIKNINRKAIDLGENSADTCAIGCYEMADAMLRERDRKPRLIR